MVHGANDCVWQVYRAAVTEITGAVPLQLWPANQYVLSSQRLKRCQADAQRSGDNHLPFLISISNFMW
jgi:hypothetical protein